MGVERFARVPEARDLAPRWSGARFVGPAVRGDPARARATHGAGRPGAPLLRRGSRRRTRPDRRPGRPRDAGRDDGRPRGGGDRPTGRPADVAGRPRPGDPMTATPPPAMARRRPEAAVARLPDGQRRDAGRADRGGRGGRASTRSACASSPRPTSSSSTRSSTTRPPSVTSGTPVGGPASRRSTSRSSSSPRNGHGPLHSGEPPWPPRSGRPRCWRSAPTPSGSRALDRFGRLCDMAAGIRDGRGARVHALEPGRRRSTTPSPSSPRPADRTPASASTRST